MTIIVFTQQYWIFKAFDRVSHGLLVGKLLRLEIDPGIVQWIKDFFVQQITKSGYRRNYF